MHEQNPNSMHEQNPNSIHDNLHGNRSNWDVICDVGTSIKQTSVADALTNYRPYEMQAGMGISANARGKTTGTIAAVTGDGSDQLQLSRNYFSSLVEARQTSKGMNQGDPLMVKDSQPGADRVSFNCDDILLGHGVGVNTHDDVLMKVNGTIGYEMQAGLVCPNETPVLW